MIFYSVIVLGILALATISYADAATIKQTMDGGMDLTVEYPDYVISGRDFAVSVFVQNNGWEDKKDVLFSVDLQNSDIMATNQTVHADRLSKGGSFGGTLKFQSASSSELGVHYLNALYSQILLSNNETPQPKLQKNIAIPITIKGEPEVQLKTTTPASIFENAEFPFEIEILSGDIALHDVAINIVVPSDVNIRGQTSYTYSVIEKNTPILIKTQIITAPSQITLEHKLPFEVQVSYTDDVGAHKTTSKDVQIVLRPRTFMEFTTDGGLWLGNFFLAPYVSMGTIIGIPAGTLFSLMVRRLQKKRKAKRRK